MKTTLPLSNVRLIAVLLLVCVMAPLADAQVEKVPYMVVVGDRDMENGTVSPRHRVDGDLGAMSLDDFTALLREVVDSKAKK